MNGKYYVEPDIVNNRFSEPEEMEKDYTEVVFENSDNPRINTAAGMGVIVRRDNNGKVTGAVVDGGDTNTIVISATGSGKSRRVLTEYITSVIYAKQSFIAHDPKGELYGFFVKLLKKLGYAVNVINFRDPMRGDRFNILQRAAEFYKNGEKGRAIEIADEIARTLYSALEEKDDPFWTDSSVGLFTCYFIIACDLYEPEDVTISNIYRIHIEGLERMDTETRMEKYLNAHKGEKCYELGITAISAPRETKQSIFSVFTRGLSRVVLNEDIADMTTDSTVDIAKMADGKRPVALFIITRDEAPGTYSTMVSSIIDMIYTSLIDLAQSKYKNNRLPRPVHFILEEFGNIARLENINDMMTASRSRGIRMVVVLQSLCQLYLNYSREVAKVLIGNSQNLIYMSSTDIELVKMISERCGEVINKYTKSKEDLLSVNELMHFDKESGEALMLMDRHYPFIGYLPDLSDYEMVEPLESIRIPLRKRLNTKYGRLTEATDLIKAAGLAQFIERNRQGAKKETEQQKIVTKSSMLDFPESLKSRMNSIIKEGIKNEFI